MSSDDADNVDQWMNGSFTKSIYNVADKLYQKTRSVLGAITLFDADESNNSSQVNPNSLINIKDLDLDEVDHKKCKKFGQEAPKILTVGPAMASGTNSTINDTSSKLGVSPCDEKPPCDPYAQGTSCEEPILCLDKIKNPALPDEITKCKEGASINANTCGEAAEEEYQDTVDTPATAAHKCDPLPSCSSIRAKKKETGPCPPPALNFDKIKNPYPDGVTDIVQPCNEDENDQPSVNMSNSFS